MKNISPPVFYYHSVAPAPFEGWLLKGLTIPLAVFEDQLAWLKARDYKSILLEEWLRIRQGRTAATGKEVCLTFDDGLLDNWVYAFPIARKYGMRFTLFVSPECIDPGSSVRPTLEDVWRGTCRPDELQGLGYLRWKELQIMQESGVVDVQSHTMTHAKYVSSPELKRFYYGGMAGLHPILNANPEIRNRYMLEPGIERRLPAGTPLFEEKSAVITRIHRINPRFVEDVTTLAAPFRLSDMQERKTFEKQARDLFAQYRRADNILKSVESEASFRERLVYEIGTSKSVLEEKLGKPVRFLCWPHGDNSMEAHALARASGYLATTSGKMLSEKDQPDRIPRIGADFTNSRPVCRLKFQYKMGGHYQKQPWYTLWKANELRHSILQNH